MEGVELTANNGTLNAVLTITSFQLIIFNFSLKLGKLFLFFIEKEIPPQLTDCYSCSLDKRLSMMFGQKPLPTMMSEWIEWKECNGKRVSLQDKQDMLEFSHMCAISEWMIYDPWWQFLSLEVRISEGMIYDPWWQFLSLEVRSWSRERSHHSNQNKTIGLSWNSRLKTEPGVTDNLLLNLSVERFKTKYEFSKTRGLSTPTQSNHYLVTHTNNGRSVTSHTHQ